MTPQEEALNNQIKALPEIVDIKNNQEEMVNSINKLSDIMASEKQQNSQEFINIKKNISELEDTVHSGLSTINASLVGLKTEIKDERFDKLSKKWDDKETDEKDSKKTKILFVQAVVVVVLSVFLTSLFANVPKLTVG